MTNVQYVGASDSRELSSADWKVLGVEDASKIRFEKGTPYEVDANVAEVLLGDGRLEGEFKEVSDAQLEKLLGSSDDEGEPDSSTVTTSEGTGDANPAGSTSTSTPGANRGRTSRASGSGRASTRT